MVDLPFVTLLRVRLQPERNCPTVISGLAVCSRCSRQPNSTGVISVGNSALGTDAYFFDFQDSGRINRAFDDVEADTNVYCWENFRNREHSLSSGSSQAIAGIIYLQLIDSGNLTIQRSTQQTVCPVDTNIPVFDSNAVQFER